MSVLPPGVGSKDEPPAATQLRRPSSPNHYGLYDSSQLLAELVSDVQFMIIGSLFGYSRVQESAAGV